MSSYAEERTAALRANSKQIRARSAEMERDVAKFLQGRRIPMSGAGAYKGDCEVETEKVGRIYIECKYSASRFRDKGPRIRIDFRWFDKMERDTITMRANFPVLVIKYHGSGRLTSYVIMRTDVLERYATTDCITGAVTISAGDKSGIELFKQTIDTAFSTHSNQCAVALLECNRGLFVIMPIAAFKDLIHDNSI